MGDVAQAFQAHPASLCPSLLLFLLPSPVGWSHTELNCQGRARAASPPAAREAGRRAPPASLAGAPGHLLPVLPT